MTSFYAIHAAEAGTAVLAFERDDDGRIDVHAVERLPAGLDPAVDWLRAMFPDLPDVGDALVLVDADGLGRALWDRLKVRRRRDWRLYEAYGRGRQELVNALLVAMSDRRIHIADVTHEAAIRKALASYKRIVGDDGVIGGELVVALALAATNRTKARTPLFIGTV